jgi:hypothetical protein
MFKVLPLYQVVPPFQVHNVGMPAGRQTDYQGNMGTVEGRQHMQSQLLWFI